MIIFLFANMKKRESFDIAKKVSDFLQQQAITVVTRDNQAEELGIAPLSTVSPQDIDFIISLGGDGTILRLVHNFPQIQAPILGINLGHLGFMADIPQSNLFPSLEEFLKGNYRIEERVMMDGVTANQERCFAVNEMVIHRSLNPSLIDLSIHVDGDYLNTFSADGVIISTPSGSTAYSLAAGGPILTPELNAFVITPISPHTISNRPIVLMPSQKIELQYLSPYEPVEITYDGFSRFSMRTNDIFSISRAERTFKIVSLATVDYFATLRTKLGWVGQVRYSELNHREEDPE
ncbi:MAG: NAD(+)/NADH kinase [Chlamydiales bacterium]